VTVSDHTQDASVAAPVTDDSGPRMLYDLPERRISNWRTIAYSRFVSLMKLLLPTVALVLATMVIIWPHLKEEGNQFRVGFSTLKERETSQPRMINPRFVGLDERDRPFAIVADLARKAEGYSSVIELEMPKADLTLDDGTWLVLTSEAGVFRQDERNLSLSGAATLFHDSGYEILMPSVLIDLAKGIASSDEPVTGNGPFGDLQAEGFILRDKGKIINFNGKARLVIYPGAGGKVW
jgi:lipopolysaccharide export system protein LptC